VARRRAQWAKYQGRIEPERLVFIDETWTKTNMAPLRGWALRGKRLPGKAPQRRWKTMTFVAALRLDRIDAPWLLEGPIDGETFRTYVATMLVPTLREGDIVIMDNLGSHKGKPSATSSARPAPNSSISRNTRRTSTRSNRSSPSSSICCARRQHVRSRPSARQSVKSSAPSPLKNAPTTSETQAIKLKPIML